MGEPMTPQDRAQKQAEQTVLRWHRTYYAGNDPLPFGQLDALIDDITAILTATAQATERRVWEEAEQIAQQEDTLNGCDVAQRIIRKLHRRRAAHPKEGA